MVSFSGNVSNAELRQIIRELVLEEMGKTEDLNMSAKRKERMPKKCKHGKQIAFCRECGGSAYCIHNRQKAFCFECGGSQMCMHGRRKYLCKECKIDDKKLL